MFKRMMTGVVAAVLAALAIGAVAAPAASAVQDPTKKCVWVWTAGGGTCQKQL